MNLDRPIVLCPLVVEQQALLRQGLAALCDIECCGPGAAQVARWFRDTAQHDHPVLLAGLAGGLNTAVATGSAYVISRVIGDDGEQWKPNWPAENRAITAATVASTEASLLTASAKQAFARRTGADLVDLESAAFATAATAAGCRWAIMRGVSDDAATPLPAGIDRWVDERGRTRLAHVAAAVARRPHLVADLWRLHRGTKTALIALGAALRTLLAPGQA